MSRGEEGCILRERKPREAIVRMGGKQVAYTELHDEKRDLSQRLEFHAKEFVLWQ